jgi:hypothetical protein
MKQRKMATLYCHLALRMQTRVIGVRSFLLKMSHSAARSLCGQDVTPSPH